MSKRYLKMFFTYIICAIVMAASGTGSIYVMAADTPVVEHEDPEDAEKGHVYIWAVVEKGYSPAIHVDLLPEFDEGVSHGYTISSENGYGVGDDIMTGPYGCICYIEGNHSDDKDMAVTYGGGTKEVVSGDNGGAYFVVVAGSSGFVQANGWLTNYTDGQGEYLKGYITQKDAQAIISVAQQDPSSAQDEQVEDAPPEEYVSPAVGPEEGQDDEQAAETGEEQEDAPEQKEIRLPAWAPAAAGIAACMLAVCFIRYIRKRKEE